MNQTIASNDVFHGLVGLLRNRIEASIDHEIISFEGCINKYLPNLLTAENVDECAEMETDTLNPLIQSIGVEEIYGSINTVSTMNGKEQKMIVGETKSQEALIDRYVNRILTHSVRLLLDTLQVETKL